MIATDAPGTPEKGWVLYDGHCGVCTEWVPRWRNVLARRGFAIAPLQAEWVNERLKMPEDDLVRDIRLLLVNGDQRQGAEVYRYVMQRIWWGTPFYVLSVLPGFNLIFDAAYRTFADNRHWISHTCRIPEPK